MNKAFLILALVAAFGARAQKKDTVVAPAITDSTMLFSIKDIAEFDDLLKQRFTVSELSRYDELFRWWQARIRQRVSEMQKPKPSPAKSK